MAWSRLAVRDSTKRTLTRVPRGLRDPCLPKWRRKAWNCLAVRDSGELQQGIELSKRLQRAILRCAARRGAPWNSLFNCCAVTCLRAVADQLPVSHGHACKLWDALHV